MLSGPDLAAALKSIDATVGLANIALPSGRAAQVVYLPARPPNASR